MSDETEKKTEEKEKVAEEETPKDKEPEKKEKEEKKKEESKPKPPPPPRVHKVDFEKDTVYLYQFSRTPTLPSLSPYCLKVETWLRLNEVKYENVDHKLKFKSSKGQLPFVEFNGEEIADSAKIIATLGTHFGIDSDAALSKENRNISHALISMIENHLCWIIVHWRSNNPDSMIKGYKVSLQHALGSRIPNAVLNCFFKLTYARKGAKKVKAQGLGVHSAEEILEFGKQDLQVLESTLGKKSFFFGTNPSNLDVVVFAHLSQIVYLDKCVDYGLRDWMLENCTGLVEHIGRMKERCFPDWDRMTETLKMNTHLPEPEPEPEPEPKKDEKEKEAAEKDEKAEKDDSKEKEAVKAEEKK